MVLAGAVALVASACATDLTTLGGNGSKALGIADTGVIVGVSKNPAGVDIPFRFEGATMSSLPLLTGFTTGEATSIDDGGDPVGWVSDGSANRAVKWPAAGGVVDLGGLGGTTSRANDVNAGGSVVGWSTTSGSTTKRATIWAPATAPAALPLPAGTTTSLALAINDAGDIVGSAGAADPTATPVRWTGPSHTVVVLGPPVGFPDISRYVKDIDTDGTAVGAQLGPTFGFPGAGWFAASWPAGQTAAVSFGEENTQAYAIDDGIAVGIAPGGAHAWVVASGKSVALPGVAGGTGTALAIASGVPVGSSTTKSGEIHATRFDTVSP